jgi:hypothetical protein
MDRTAIIKALRDTAQSASNAVATNVSGPVDLLAAGLRKLGVPVPRNALGGSQWMADQGLTREVAMGAPRIIGETLGMAGPAVLAGKAPQIAGAMNRGMDNLAAPRTLNNQAGAIVWHGSPHKFDKFDASKIGTGEGAQAYGHGLYLAESPDVAKQYRDILTGKTRSGQPLNWDDPLEVASMRMHQFQGDKDAAIQFVAGQRPNPSVSKANAKAAAYSDQVIEAIRSGKATAQVDGGQLYKVDLPDEHIAKMLDWDKALSQQHPEVQKALSTVAKGSMSGEQAWKAAIRESGNPFSSITPKSGALFDTPEAASENLRRLGIPGIRYLDGGSRGAGQGSSNFVIFPQNEGLLKILERNGKPIK